MLKIYQKYVTNNEKITKNGTKISAENEPKPAEFQEQRKANKRAETVAGARFLGFRAYRSYVKKRLKTIKKRLITIKQIR